MADSKLQIVIGARDEAQKVLKGISKDVNGLGKMLGDVGKMGAGFAGGMLGLNAAGGAFGFIGKAVIGMNANLERSTMQFQTMMGDADAAKEHVKGLFQFAADTPFETGPIIEASRHLMNLGGAALATEDNLKMVGNAAAGTSQNIDEVAFWVGRAYSSIKAGRPFGEASMRLQEMGVLSAEARNKLDELTQSGGKTADVWRTLTGDMTRFEGAMTLQAKSWDGLLSTIQDNVMMGLAEAFDPIFLKLKDLASEIADFVQTDQFKGWILDISAGTSDAIDGMVAFGDEIKQTMDDVLPYIESTRDAIRDTVLWLKQVTGSAPNAGFHAGLGMAVDPEALAQQHIQTTRGVREPIARAPRASAAASGPFEGWRENMGEAKKEVQKTAEEIREAMRNIIASSGDLAMHFASINPAAQIAAEGVAAYKLQLVGAQDQQEAMSESIRQAQDVLRGMQERVGEISDALSEAKSRLQGLANVRLAGQGAMDEKTFQIEQQIKRLKLAALGQDTSAFAPLTAEARAFAATLPKTVEELEKMLEVMGLQGSLRFDEQLRAIAEAAKGADKEMSFEAALQAISATKGDIAGLEGQLWSAQAATKGQEGYIRSLEDASRSLSRAIQGMQEDLRMQEQKQQLVNDALKTAFQWFGDDRQKVVELGGEAVTQAGIVDEETRKLLLATSEYARGEAATAIAAIGAALDAYRTARTEMAMGLLNRGAGGIDLGVGGSVSPPSGGDTNVTVQVQGSVIAERDLAERVREELIRIGRRNVSSGVS